MAGSSAAVVSHGSMRHLAAIPYGLSRRVVSYAIGKTKTITMAVSVMSAGQTGFGPPEVTSSARFGKTELSLGRNVDRARPASQRPSWMERSLPDAVLLQMVAMVVEFSRLGLDHRVSGF